MTKKELYLQIADSLIDEEVINIDNCDNNPQIARELILNILTRKLDDYEIIFGSVIR